MEQNCGSSGGFFTTFGGGSLGMLHSTRGFTAPGGRAGVSWRTAGFLVGRVSLLGRRALVTFPRGALEGAFSVLKKPFCSLCCKCIMVAHCLAIAPTYKPTHLKSVGHVFHFLSALVCSFLPDNSCFNSAVLVLLPSPCSLSLTPQF